jgi:flagellar biosynthesis/type III secretory pathway protein FliH
MVGTLSSTETLEKWAPNDLFVPKDLAEDNFLKEESLDDRDDFVPRSLVQVSMDAQLEIRAPGEEMTEIEPLQPHEPNQDNEVDQSNIDIDSVRQEAFAEGEIKGLAEGRRLAQDELADRQQQFEIEARDELQSFMSSIKENLIHHNRLAEPLKRLAVALAEHIARAEVQVSDRAIDNLIERVVGELEPGELEDVVLTVSPGWRDRIAENQFDPLFENYEIRVSENLSDGSVRLSTEDKTIEDLIEERITQIASQVFNVKFPMPNKIDRHEEVVVEEASEDLLNTEIEEADVIEDPALEQAVVVDENSGSQESAGTIVENDESTDETPFVMEPPEIEGSDESHPLTDDD